MDQGPFGSHAKAQLERLLPIGRLVDLHLDVDKEDRFGRTLAYVVRSDGVMVNEEMVRAGYAMVRVYPPNVQHVERMRAAAQAAQNARRGLWNTSAFECAPADHRAGRCR